MKASFKVREDLTWWTCDGTDDKYEPGEVHEVSGEALVAMVAAAEAAGSLVEVEYDAGAKTLAGKSVQSQEDGEAALTKAMGDVDDEGHYTGPWAEGNALLAGLDEGNIEIGTGD